MDVIVNSENYNEEAVKAAEEELKNRNLSEMEIAGAEKTVLSRKDETIKGNKIATFVSELQRILDPAKEKSPEETLKLVCGALICNILYKLYQGFHLLQYLLQYSDFGTPVLYGYIISCALSVTIVVLVWKKIRAGYYMLLIWLILSVALFSFAALSKFVINQYNSVYVSVTSYFVYAILYSCLLWAVCRKKFRSNFFGSVTKEEDVEKLINEIKVD